MPIFDSLNYSYQGGSITLQYLQQYYLPLIGGTITGNLYVNGILSIQPSQLVIGSTTVTSTATQLNYVNVTPGTAAATSALILDSGRNIININNIGVNTVSIGSAVLNATDLGYISGTTPGTASSSQALILDSSRNITNINNLTLTGLLTSPNVSISGTTDSTSTTTGCLTLAGGLGIAKSLFVGTAINVTNTVGGNLLTLSSGSTTSARSTLYFQTDTQNWEFGARGSTAANANCMYIYNGGYKLVMQSNGNTTLNAQLTLNNNGSNLIFNNASNSALIELANTSPTTLRLVNSYAVNISSGGVVIENASTRTARYQLDFGATANDCIINLYQSGTNALYGIGANNSATEIHTGGDVTMYNGTTANGSLGTKLATINSGGNVIAQSGIHANSFSTTGLAAFGNCIHMHYGGGLGSIFTYNYSNSTYGTTVVNNNNLICGSNGFTNMNTSNTTTSFPLSVFGSGLGTRLTGTYGYLASSGSGTASGFTNRSFSAYMDYGILVGISGAEIDCFSDIRLKKDIVPLDNDLVNRFMNIEPISFQYKQSEEKNKHYGYRAQDLVKNLFTDLVGFTDMIDEHDLQPEDIECIDGSIVHLESNQKLVVSLLNVIPILHKAIQLQAKKIESLESKFREAIAKPSVCKILESHPTRVSDRDPWRAQLESLQIDLQEQINEIIDHLNQ